MLFKEASDMARLLRIGAIAEAYLTPSSLPIFLGAYIIDPGYISIALLSNDDPLYRCVVPSGSITTRFL